MSQCIAIEHLSIYAQDTYIVEDLSLNLEKTSLLFDKLEIFDNVIKGSITFLRAFAFGNVVVILSCFIKEFARFLNMEIL